ncbi:MAG: penicillin acylase family protein [Paracoccaceae bacterium]|jgi:penicillin amidase|nr:penicillin acylase family protein [Paracoccaceae bacterium]
MAQLFLWSLRLFMALALLAFAAVGLTYVFAARSLPDYDATHAVRGVGGEVEIVRDNANVPHIFAGSERDVFFGLGFAHAQDRLWQMTVLRRRAQGRLSEIFGPRTLAEDELMRRLGLARAARQSLAAQDQATRTALEAYADGVNAWIAEVNEGARGRGAPEFFLFPPEIAPWQPQDSIAVLKLLAWEMTAHPEREVLRARAALRLPDNRLADLMPDFPPTGPSAVPQRPPPAIPATGPLPPPLAEPDRIGPASPGDGAALPIPDGFRGGSAGREPDGGGPDGGGLGGGASNAWAAAPARSAAGGSILANDPHGAFSAPTRWYLARLQLASGGVIGATVPGVPLILAGRSERMGWGITAAWADDADIYMEELNPGDTSQYRTPRGWRPFETERTIVRVADAPPLTLTLRRTENGPVLPAAAHRVGEVTPPGHVAALAWTGTDTADTTMSAGLALMRAGSVDEAMAAGEGFVAPALVLTLVDDSRIAMQLVGRLPARDPGQTGQGRIPALGWKETNRWQGALPYDRNPRFLEPASGVLGTTNNRVSDRPFPDHVSHVWGDSQRIERLRRLLADREVHTRESFIAAQLDTVSYTARSLLPLIARELWFQGEAAPEGSPERRRQRALELLAEWNGEMNEHLPEPLIYAAWMRRLQARLVADELGPLADAFARPEPLFIERVFRDVGGAAAWCDIVQSTAVETCPELARIALDEALIEIDETWGRQLESLRWGDAHEATHRHPELGEVPVLKWIVNIRQSTSGGDHTLNLGATAGATGAPYANVAGPGYRGVYDFADPDSSVFVIATGQSGHPLSRHYDDLGALWRRGEYVPMTLDPELARAGGVGVTTLRPE